MILRIKIIGFKEKESTFSLATQASYTTISLSLKSYIYQGLTPLIIVLFSDNTNVLLYTKHSLSNWMMRFLFNS